ncbi:MAG: methionyl-tRNA formyltransferase [Bacteroidia bacterium]|nr:methionyl-tRNA formyltransferase [Bacteroidia bacterium]
MDKQSLRIIFFGTPDFAVASLKAIVEAGYNIVAVVTAPDKASGRGYKIQSSAVKTAADELGILTLQPEKLKSPEFIDQLKSLNADLQIVIAFRMLPEIVWNMPRLGTFNLHASLLPSYRGAAPINHAIINGEKTTGVSTFFLRHAIDTGAIILQSEIQIDPKDNAGALHDKLMIEGSKLVVKTLDKILDGPIELLEQASGHFPEAPKIFTETCKINLDKNAEQVHNFIRGLSPYPGAHLEFNGKKLKVLESHKTENPSREKGLIEIEGKHKLLAHCSDYILEFTIVQPEGKKKMSSTEFINGMRNTI